MSAAAAIPSQPPTTPPTEANPRFTLELEFVSALANPSYLQYLGVTYPNLFNPSTTKTSSSITTTTTSSTSTSSSSSNTDASCFARYLKYLLYWKQPQYAQFLTHPAATIRNLELLQIEAFRRDVTRPEMLALLSGGFRGVGEYVPPSANIKADEQGGHETGTARAGEGEDANGEEDGQVHRSTADAGVGT